MDQHAPRTIRFNPPDSPDGFASNEEWSMADPSDDQVAALVSLEMSPFSPLSTS